MAEALRRLLWLFPIFGLGSALLFALFSWGLKVDASDPLFFNQSPRGAREHAAEAMAAVAKGADPRAPERLAKLGGAALPFVLPRLEELTPEERGRVTVALAPIARRMGVARDEAVLEDPVAGSAFWARFWQDRSLDFRDVVVTRQVRRLSQRSLALRRADLAQLDTYALPELIGSLGVVKTDEDVARVRRLLRVASEITGQAWTLPQGSSPQAARRAVTQCRRWWDDHRWEYTDVTGLRRLTAAVVQTRYARWTMRTLREMSGRDESELWQGLRSTGRVTACLLAFSLLGGLTLGALGAASALSLFPGKTSLLRPATAVIAGLAVPGLAFWAHGGALVTACALAFVLGAAPALQLFLREMDERIDYRGRHVLLARTPLRRTLAVGRWSLMLIPTWAPLALVEATAFAFVLEWSLRLPGAGPRTIKALASGDIHWLMAVCLTLGVVTALTQIAADGLIGTARTRRGGA